MKRISMASTKTSEIGRRRVRAGALCAALAAAFALAAVAEAGSPRALIQRTIDEVLAILRDSKKSDTQRRPELEAIARDRFDFETMSRLVLAANWKKLTPSQQTEFVDEF